MLMFVDAMCVYKYYYVVLGYLIFCKTCITGLNSWLALADCCEMCLWSTTHRALAPWVTVRFNSWWHAYLD